MMVIRVPYLSMTRKRMRKKKKNEPSKLIPLVWHSRIFFFSLSSLSLGFFSLPPLPYFLNSRLDTSDQRRYVSTFHTNTLLSLHPYIYFSSHSLGFFSLCNEAEEMRKREKKP